MERGPRENSTGRVDQAFFDALSAKGYAILPDVLAVGEVESAIQRIDAIAAAERAAAVAWFSHCNQRIFNLTNKGQLFLDLIEHRAAMEIVDRYLGLHCLLSSITANIALPGNRPQPLHADQGYLPQPWLRSEVLNIVYVLDEFTEDNGATRVVAGSHLAGTAPPERELPTEPIVAPAGALICLDGRVWHGTGQNFGPAGARRAIFAYYCRPYIRQQENFSRSLAEELRGSLTPVQRRLLGFDIWHGLGSVNGLPISWMDGRERIGPLELHGIGCSRCD